MRQASDVARGITLAFATFFYAAEHRTSSEAAAALPFRAGQPELFAVANSYSNAWADYDNDDDLDLAVSIGSGEVQLYRNEAGVLVSAGEPVGMPAAQRCAV